MTGVTLLLYPHQLFEPAQLPERDRTVLLEDPLFFGTDERYPLPFHKQKLVLHRASMQRYAAELRRTSPTRVDYFCFDVDQASTEGVSEVFAESDRVVVFDPCDYLVERRLHAQAEQFPKVDFEILSSPGWLLSRDEVQRQFGDRDRPPRMATFYRHQRQQLGLLLDGDGGPLGGRWSFDTENRRKLPRDYQPPAFVRFGADPQVRAAQEWVDSRFPDNPGSTADFWWPTNHSEARLWLADFLEHRFDDFGPYEDALDGSAPLLQHSGLSVLLNLGLLTPTQVIDAVMERDARSTAPIASLEGFLRQVIGWREYVRAVYVEFGTQQRTANVLQHDQPLPASIWGNDTGLPPVDDVLKKLTRNGYAHHIERLMVLGNIMCLIRTNPDEVYRWFMAQFLDAYDWVMVPNVYGMSQFADGGLMTTKPYVAGSNYIRKMSRYPAGDWCDAWDGLYWSFVADNRPLFAKNPRTAAMLGNLDRMAPTRRERLQAAASAWRATQSYD